MQACRAKGRSYISSAGWAIATREQVYYSRRSFLLAGLGLLAAFVFLLLAGGAYAKLDRAVRAYSYAGIRGLYQVILEHTFSTETPSVAWVSAAPEAYGLNSARLDAWEQALAQRGTASLLIARGDRIVYEWYAPGYGPNDRHWLAALAKPVVSATALMVSLDDGRLSLDDPAWKYIPEWKQDPVRSQITLRHLAAHSSGIENVAYGADPDLTGWKASFDKDRTGRFSMALRDAPVLFSPGADVLYSSVGYYALAYAHTASLADAPQLDIRSLLEERVMKPLGIPGSAWRISYGESYSVDGLKLYATASGAEFTPRAIARIGQLMLNRGEWNGERIVSPEWVDTTTSYSGPPSWISTAAEPAPAIGWRTNHDGFFPSLPRDALIGSGAGHQVLLVVPSLDLVMVRVGESLDEVSHSDTKGLYWQHMEDYLFSPMMNALSQPSASSEGVAANRGATERAIRSAGLD